MRLRTSAASLLLLTIPLTSAASSSNGSYVDSLPQYARELFVESMTWMDTFYDASANYLYDLSATAALHHNTRSSVWYALGLLARNEGDDVTEAQAIITEIIRGQNKNESEQWYGDYQQEPEEPSVGSPAYQPKIYGSWDPNWRGFVGTTFIVALEEFGHLISNSTTSLMLESLHNATVGDSYRVGGVDGDNLYPAYSNPGLMRAFTSGWTGRRLNDSNMTTAGETYAQEMIDLFNRANTLSEFNSGTYTGVSLWALSLWSKYLPRDSVMGEYGPIIANYTWQAVGQLWHPGLKNMAGPWDRSYGYDMNRYVSLMALHFWTLAGKESSSLVKYPQVMSHSADYAWGPAIAVLAPFASTLVPSSVLPLLSNFSGEHTFTSSTYSPPYDYQPRNITTWLSDKVTIGAQSYNQSAVGGPSLNQKSYNPAVIQWDSGSKQDGIGFITLYVTAPALIADVQPGSLSLTYPTWNSSSVFSFIVSTVKSKPTLTGWEDLAGINVNLTANFELGQPSLSFAGLFGGSDSVINDFEFWNFTYAVPGGLSEPPNVVLSVETTP